jgi:hypothetical protein
VTDSAAYDDDDLASLLVARGLLGSEAVPRAGAGELAALVLSRGLVPRRALESVLDELARHQFRCRKCKTPFAALPHSEPRRFPCPRCKKINVLPTLEDSAPVTEFAGAPPAPAPEGDPLPARFGRYAIEAEIARGAMGIVYRAHHDDLPTRPVALKVLQAPLASDRELLERFKREAQALARIDHANVVRVHDAGTEDGIPWFAMELATGKTLEDLLDQGPLEPRRAAALVEPVARAVAHLHSRGILHRDLKLGNVLVSEDGTPKLSDFGLARLLDRETRLTADGDRLGTPLYMAPEQVMGSLDLDGRADVYSLGIMFFRLITKSYPFLAKTTLQLYAKVLSESATWPENAPTDPGIRGVCERAFARDPVNRYPTALALARDLEMIARSGSALARAPGRLELLSRALVRQRRVLVAVASVVFLLLVIAFVRWSIRARAESDAGSRLAEAQRRIERLASGARRPPSALRAEVAAVTSLLEVARAAGVNVTELEEELRAGVATEAWNALREIPLGPLAARDVARGRSPYDPGELRALEELVGAFAGRPVRGPDLERTRSEALLLAGRPREARAGAADPRRAALLAGAPVDAPGDPLAVLAIEPGEGSIALRVARVDDEQSLWKKADLDHVGDGADAASTRVLLGERLLERGAFASAASVFEIALGRGRRDSWNGNPRALWGKLATEPHVAEVVSGVRATGPLGAFAVLGRARARAELPDESPGLTAIDAANDAVAALESMGPLAASAHLLAARAHRAAGELALASHEEEAARLADDGSLAGAIADASRRTGLLAEPGDRGAGEDERTLDLVADARTELACGSPTIDAPEGDARALAAARRLAGLALERSPGSGAALAVFARSEAALGGRGQSLASRAVERAHSADACEALAIVFTAQGNAADAESCYEDAAQAIEAQKLRLLATDHELVLLRRRAAFVFAAKDPKRALAQLELAIACAKGDATRPPATPRALEVLHREAAHLALPQEVVREHQRLENEAYAARIERDELGKEVFQGLAPLQRARIVGESGEDAARRLTADCAPRLERMLRAGFADGWLLCMRRDLDVLTNLDPKFLYEDRALALECEPEVFGTILIQTGAFGRNVLASKLPNEFVRVADGAVRTYNEHRACMPHGTDPDFEEALALAQAGMLETSPPERTGQAIEAARRYLRHHPAMRAGRLVLARLFLEAREPGEALVELGRARRLPGILGSKGLPPGSLDVTRAEIAVLDQDPAEVRKALETAKANGIQLFPWWFDAKRGGPFAGQGLSDAFIDSIEGRH